MVACHPAFPVIAAPSSVARAVSLPSSRFVAGQESAVMDVHESVEKIQQSQDVFGVTFYKEFFARHPEVK
jgi:hypothetical protein